MMRSGSPLVLFTAGLLLAGSARAGHPLATDDVSTVGAGQASVGLASSAAGDPERTLFQQDVALDVGLLDGLDIGVAFAHASALADGSLAMAGAGEPVVDLKLRLWQPQGTRPGMALRLDYQVPRLSPNSTGAHGAGTHLIASWQGPVLALHAMAGLVAHQPVTAGPHLGTGGGLAVTAGLGEHLTALGEVTADLLPWEDSIAIAGLLGATWKPSAGSVLSMGAGPGRVGGQPIGWQASVGLTLVLSMPR